MEDLAKQNARTSAKPYIKFFLLYGLLNMSISIMWGAYNNYFPIILQAGNPNYTSASTIQVAGFGLSAFVTGLIMSVDNMFATFFLPIFGAWGDRTTKRKELGVIFGLLCVVSFVALPLLASLISPAMSGNTQALTPILIPAVALVFLCMFSDAVGRPVPLGLSVQHGAQGASEQDVLLFHHAGRRWVPIRHVRGQHALQDQHRVPVLHRRRRDAGCPHLVRTARPPRNLQE